MRIFPLSESALTIEFGNEISLELNERAIALADRFSRDPFPGLIESVPAYSSVTLFYDRLRVKEAFPDAESAFAAVERIAHKTVSRGSADSEDKGRLVEIPMTVSSDASPDLNAVAEKAGVAVDDALNIFFGRTYRVFMLGFLPGFAYMGEVEGRIATPRLARPRTNVPKGSIGIAGKQTGIYPLDSPGGWNIIGRTDLPMFDPDREEPCLLRPGDDVRFVRI